ncbi:uncharacterized protein FTOL_13365 [Fusarium torulosum]|uniref:Uncharacterized protein n=1 Tax=Fusarium torulosum TaxID=33205 RepID=A0AAE8SQ78_9HYPO|nr:uncharacterized protein FTOL_13365 [Fusarium torulosum]
MNSSTLSPTPIANTVKTIRKRSIRSRYINLLIITMKAELAEEGTITLLSQTLEEFVGLEHMDLAMTVFNLHRFCFHERQLTGNSWLSATNYQRFRQSNAWNIARYYIETLLDWKRLQEFLELADGIRQLSTAFASIPNPEKNWKKFFKHWHRAASEEALSGNSSSAGSNRHLRLVRFQLWRAACRNAPGSKPIDINGKEIDKDFFNRTLREFWHRELWWRGVNLELQYCRGRIPQDSGAHMLLARWADKLGDVEVKHFSRLIRTQRLLLSAQTVGIEDHHSIGKLWKLLNWDLFNVLGTSGHVACLPVQDDKYKMQFVLQLSATAMQLYHFWCDFEGHHNVVWYDGWHEKYPVSGSIDHVTLDIDYSSDETEEEEDDVPTTATTAAGITS